jgi:Flp pilus assembly protein TadG
MKSARQKSAINDAPRAARRGLTRKQRGVATIEFALIAPLLFLLVCFAMDLGIALWVNLTMQYAVREGARYSVTGQTNLDPNATSQQRYLAVVQEIKNSSMGLYSLVSPSYVVTINGATQTYNTQTSYSTGMFGNPGDIVVLQINCIWPLLTPLVRPFFANGKFSFSVAATMRNEGF